MSNFLGGFQTYTQLPLIDQSKVFTGDSAYTVDDGSYWIATQPSAPPGAQAVWLYIDTLRGQPGPQGETGVGLPGPQGQIGLQGSRGQPGPQGPPGRNAFSYLSHMFTVPAYGAPPVTVSTSDTSWMTPGLLVYIPNAGTFTIVGPPLDAYNIQLVNSNDPNNAPPGTMVNAGNMISPANQRGPIGPAGQPGPQGPAGPQGVGGASAYTTLVQPFTIPAAEGVAFVLNAASFSVGLIVYVASGAPNGVYCSVAAVNATANTLTLQNQGYPGGDPIGTVAPAGATVSGTGPQGPQGIQGPPGPQGIQGPVGLAPTGSIVMYGSPSPPGGWLNCDGSAKNRLQFGALFAIIGTTFGVGLNDGATFSLPNFQGNFPLGYQSGTYPMAATGGATTQTLSIANLAPHNHTASDSGHAHVVPAHGHGWNDANHENLVPAHGHGFNFGDPGHVHTYQSGSYGGIQGGGGNTVGYNNTATNTSTVGTGLAPYLSVANAGQFWTGGVNTAVGSVANAGAFWDNTNYANISVANTGSGTPFAIMPPYQVVNYIIKT